MQKVKQFAFERKDLCIRAAGALALAVLLIVTLSLTVFAETTYFINDGERQLVHKTDATEPEEVLEEAGLELNAYDQITHEEGFLSATITIRRAVNMVINYYGEPMDVVAYEDETLETVLTRLELTWNEADVLSQDLQTLAYEGLTLAVTSIEVKEETYTESIPFETTKVKDDNMKKDAKKTRTEGKNGEKIVTASVTYVNGVETEREILNEEVTLEPVKEVVAVGTGKNLKSYGYKGGEVTIGNGTITLASGKTLTYSGSRTMKATAYTHTDAGCNKTTATGTTVRWGTVAVDPRYIPYGTKMFIVTNDGYCIYGEAVAEDCGGAIKNDRIDLYMPSRSQCLNFGRRTCTVYFLN